jgi:hypothetical protein
VESSVQELGAFQLGPEHVLLRSLSDAITDFCSLLDLVRALPNLFEHRDELLRRRKLEYANLRRVSTSHVTASRSDQRQTTLLTAAWLIAPSLLVCCIMG